MFLTAVVGGGMIGLSAAILLVCNGDILGFSGIVSSVVLPPSSPGVLLVSSAEHVPSVLQDAQQHWKLVFLASFLATSHFVIGPRFEEHHQQQHMQEHENNLLQQSFLRYLVAGFLVGFGTQLGNGCTSGHGICGLSRFSPRSIVAVLTFMTSAIITTTLVLPSIMMRIQQQQQQQQNFTLRGEHDDAPRNRDNSLSSWLSTLLVIVSIGAALISTFVYKSMNDATARAKAIPALVTGILMSLGLFVSEMTYPANIVNFLNLSLIHVGTWDASLIVVMISGIFVSSMSYQIIPGYKIGNLGFNAKTIGHPILLGRRSQFNIPTNKTIDAHLVLGAVVFGIGWSIGGLCPAPAMLVAAIGGHANANTSLVFRFWWPAYIFGAYLAREIKVRKAPQPVQRQRVQQVAK